MKKSKRSLFILLLCVGLSAAALTGCSFKDSDSQNKELADCFLTEFFTINSDGRNDELMAKLQNNSELLPTKLFCTMLWKNIITAYRNTSPMSVSINCLPSERCGGLTRISSVRETSGQFPHWIFRILPRLIPTASMQS